MNNDTSTLADWKEVMQRETALGAEPATTERVFLFEALQEERQFLEELLPWEESAAPEIVSATYDSYNQWERDAYQAGAKAMQKKCVTYLENLAEFWRRQESEQAHDALAAKYSTRAEAANGAANALRGFHCPDVS